MIFEARMHGLQKYRAAGLEAEASKWIRVISLLPVSEMARNGRSMYNRSRTAIGYRKIAHVLVGLDRCSFSKDVSCVT